MAVVVAIDAGTTGVRTMAFGAEGGVVASSYREFPQYFPRPGWVEHDPEEIWQAVVATFAEVLTRLDQPVAAIGITNQRETVVLWDRRDGTPLRRAVVWQDRRSAGICDELAAGGHLDIIRRRTGLVLDPYFSATKLAWLIRHGEVEPNAHTAFGTVDSWIIWRLTGGRTHLTDPTNASRTLVFDIGRLEWDSDLADLLGIPTTILPEVGPSSGRLGTTAPGVVPGLAPGVPISGVAGDQQAALFGQACFSPGMTKNTYGTGSFVLMNVGSSPPPPVDGLLSTVAWSLGEVRSAATAYALEGAIFVTGAAVQWLRDGLGIIGTAAEVGPLAATVADSGGCFFVPALTGLGSPWWDPHARGTVVGLTRGVGRAQLARAAVEAMVFQTADVVASMTTAAGRPLAELRVDGGASAMDLLLGLQAELLGVPVRRTSNSDITAVGAAFLAGLAEGVWASLDEISAVWKPDAAFEPGTADHPIRAAFGEWHRAVERSLAWEQAAF